MYKSIPADIKKVRLDANLYALHKSGTSIADFGMDNTPNLLDNGFGLYSTVNIKPTIGPMKTQFYRIGLMIKGSAHFSVGLEQYNPQAGHMLFGFPGQVFSLSGFSDDWLAYYMLFTEEFIAEILPARKGDQFPFLSYSGLQSFPVDNSVAAEIVQIIFRMNDEIKAHRADCSEMIRIYIRQILVHARRSYGNTAMAAQNSPPLQMLHSRFLKEVGQHFLTVRKVSAYADMLCVSPDHLNRAIKTCSDKTAHELIDEMLILEAKTYLLHTDLSIAEIGYKLDFTDPSHFNRFFKKYCAATPAAFRKQSELVHTKQD